MRRVLALILLALFATRSSVAGVNSHQAKVAGDSIGVPPVESVGFLETQSEVQLDFRYKAGKNGDVGHFTEGTFDLPYAKVNRFIYGDTKHLRIGQTIALTALAGVGGLLLLLSKSHTHYLSVEYNDDSGHGQVISFEVGKDAIRPLLATLELRTGKKTEYEAAPGTTAKNVP